MVRRHKSQPEWVRASKRLGDFKIQPNGIPRAGEIRPPCIQDILNDAQIAKRITARVIQSLAYQPFQWVR